MSNSRMSNSVKIGVCFAILAYTAQLYRLKYGIDFGEILRYVSTVIVFFGVPGYCICKFFLPKLNFITSINAMLYISCGIPLTLLVFYLSHYYEKGVLFWIFIGNTSICH